MMTAAGWGYSRWRDLAVTRWREDPHAGRLGNVGLSARCSPWRGVVGRMPGPRDQPDSYEVDFSEDHAEIVRQDGSLLTTYEVVVSPEDDAEIRRVTLKNLGTGVREINVTSYAELGLNTAAADQSHTTFSNLFVETEFVPEVNGLLATRRRRSPEDPSVWAAHVVVVEGESGGVSAN